MQQLARLRDGTLVRVHVEPIDQELIYQQDEYDPPARQWPDIPHRRRMAKRNGEHPISMFFLFLFVGFCACGIHPVITFLLWGVGVLELIKAALKRR